jgi:hypothetical protein
MANSINRLSARGIQALSKQGRHADGGNLYVNVSPAGAKSWVLLYRFEDTSAKWGSGRCAMSVWRALASSRPTAGELSPSGAIR